MSRKIKISAILLCAFMLGQTFGEKIPELTVEHFTSNSTSSQAVIQLTANDCFFGPTGTLKCVEDLAARGTGSDYNKNYVFTHITNWSSEKDTIIWGINIIKTGSIYFQPELGVPDLQAGSEIELVLVNKNIVHTDTLVLKSTGSYSEFKLQDSVQFNISESGNYIFKMRIINKKVNNNVADIRNIDIYGPAAKTSEVIQRRWRPLAVHTKWKSSQNPEKVLISVHENTIITTDVDMYQPITTPFGYTGSTWDPKTLSFKVYNFSLWSFSANSSAPPIEEMSHLIAVGKGLTFGEFSHEGTGVKPRGPSPYIGFNTNTQTIAVRMEPGIPYNTFYSYYLSPETGRWSFYGCGRTYNKKNKIEYLSTGAFIEVVGPPGTARSGHRLREVQYRGWQMEESGEWYVIDQMNQEANDSELSFKNFGIEENKFYMQMGGLESKVLSNITISKNDSSALPEFLKGDQLAELYQLPAEFIALPVDSITSNSVSLNFDIKKLGSNPLITLYWGSEEALTFQEKWQNSKYVYLAEGMNNVSLKDLTPNTKYFYRLRIVNGEGTTWLKDTQSFTTIVTDVEEEPTKPNKYGLYQNYPNPFNPSTTIEYYIPKKNAWKNQTTTFVSLKIYDILGCEVKMLVNNELLPGEYKVSFKSNNLASGVYYYCLKADGYYETKKMILIR